MSVNRLVVVAVAVVVGAVLAGCSGAASSARPTTSPTATPTPTPSRASAPSLRVPATCDELVPASVIAKARTAVAPLTVTPAPTPAAYADERAGVLSCSWSSAEQWGNTAAVQIWLKVVPDATSQAIADDRNGSFGLGTTQTVAGSPDSFRSCAEGFFQLCGFEALAGGYGISVGVWDYGSATFASQSAVLDAFIAATVPAVTALPAPAPLWQPEGAGLRGASDCDALLTIPQLLSATGWQGAHAYKGDDGENALSTLETNRRVGSYWCAFSSDQASEGVSASVLPGGASFAPAARPSDAVDLPGVGESAYVTPDGELNVIAAHGWVQVQGKTLSREQLTALAKQVLVNVGYTG